MRAWLQHHRLSFAQTLARLVSAPFATLLNTLAIGAALALPLGGYCLLVNLEPLSRNLSAEPELSVFLASDVAKPDITAVETQLKGTEGVRSVRFVGRDAALTELKRTPGMAEVIATLRQNPLPDAFVVTLASTDAALSDRLEQQFKALPKVSHVQADSAWVKRLDALLRLGRATVVLLGVLLGLVLVAVTFNTIRLQILTQNDEIELCRLIGATRAYIRRPFFYLGSLLGLLGGLAAIALALAAMAWINRDLAQLGVLFGSEFRLQFLNLQEMAAAVAGSVALGWAGSYMSVSKHLREIEPS